METNRKEASYHYPISSDSSIVWDLQLSCFSEMVLAYEYSGLGFEPGLPAGCYATMSTDSHTSSVGQMVVLPLPVRNIEDDRIIRDYHMGILVIARLSTRDS